MGGTEPSRCGFDVREGRVRVGVQRRDGHQALETQPGEAGDVVGEREEAVGRDSAAGRVTVDAVLQQDRQRTAAAPVGAGPGGGGGERVGEADGVHRLDAVRPADDGPALATRRS